MNLRLAAGTASLRSGPARRAWGAGALVGLMSALLLSVPSAAIAATAGWAGETIVSAAATGNGWEPAIAADPSAPYVYAAWMQYNGNRVTISVRVSSDGGATWGPSKALCTNCNGGGQFDVVLSTSGSGAV